MLIYRRVFVILTNPQSSSTFQAYFIGMFRKRSSPVQDFRCSEAPWQHLPLRTTNFKSPRWVFNAAISSSTSWRSLESVEFWGLPRQGYRQYQASMVLLNWENKFFFRFHDVMVIHHHKGIECYLDQREPSTFGKSCCSRRGIVGRPTLRIIELCTFF